MAKFVRTTLLLPLFRENRFYYFSVVYKGEIRLYHGQVKYNIYLITQIKFPLVTAGQSEVAFDTPYNR